MENHNQNQGHKQSKREIREDKVIDSAYNIQTTNILSQLHNDLQHQQSPTLLQRNTNDNDDLNHVPSSSSGKIGRRTIKGKISFTNQPDIDNHENGDKTIENDYNDINGYSKTMRVTFKLKNGKITHKIALQRTQYGGNGHRNISSKMKRNDNDSTESVYANDNHDKMVMTGQIKSNVNENGNALTDNNNEYINNNNNDAENTDDLDTITTINHDNESFNDTKNQLHRFKRKSGKAAGALGRPKAGSDSGSKSTSRKKDGKWNKEWHDADAG